VKTTKRARTIHKSPHTPYNTHPHPTKKKPPTKKTAKPPKATTLPTKHPQKKKKNTTPQHSHPPPPPPPPPHPPPPPPPPPPRPPPSDAPCYTGQLDDSLRFWYLAYKVVDLRAGALREGPARSALLGGAGRTAPQTACPLIIRALNNVAKAHGGYSDVRRQWRATHPRGNDPITRGYAKSSVNIDPRRTTVDQASQVPR